MVKNTGGNKAKKFASKSFNISDRATRFATESGETYAVVQRMLGSNMCEVLCIDASIKLCVIRGKFSGRGKRDNRIGKGSWVLVGTRSWEVTTKGKEKCDLLEVYSDGDKERLIKNSRENFRVFLSVSNEDDDNLNDHIKFINDREETLAKELSIEITSDISDKDNISEDEQQIDKESESNMSKVLKQLDWVDIDDI